jgi:hypothetical protein
MSYLHFSDTFLALSLQRLNLNHSKPEVQLISVQNLVAAPQLRKIHKSTQMFVLIMMYI